MGYNKSFGHSGRSLLSIYPPVNPAAPPATVLGFFNFVASTFCRSFVKIYANNNISISTILISCKNDS